jgi:tetratricopeptide (TPR) repeat protein
MYVSTAQLHGGSGIASGFLTSTFGVGSLKQDCAACWLQLGRIAEKQANLEQALAFLISAKRISPQAPEILAATGRICLKQDLYTDAIENLSAAVKLRPDNESSSYMLASALVGKQRYKDAIPLLTRSLSHHPEDSVLNYSVGAVELLNQDLRSRTSPTAKPSVQTRPSRRQLLSGTAGGAKGKSGRGPANSPDARQELL